MKRILNLVNDRSGNFGMFTGLLLVPLVGTAGMALDFGHALALRSDLMGLADAAAIGSIAEGSPAYKSANAMTKDGAVPVGTDYGRQLFASQRSITAGTDLASLNLQVSVNIEKQGASVTSVTSFAAEVPTMFMRVFGKNSVSISGRATAAYGTQGKSFTNFYMLLDNTPSMGIAATKKEMDKLKSLTSNKCAFACHIGTYSSSGKFNQDPSSTYIVARNNGITLRIDVVAKAAEALITKVRNEMAASADQYRVATYSFGKYALEPGYRIDKLSSLTHDMTSASKATGDVALMTIDHDHFNQNALTSFDTSLTLIGKEISGDGGTGATAADPREIVYFVTDGMGDSLKPGGKCGGKWHGDKGRCLEPIDTKYCEALKARDIKIAVLYTTYVPLDGDDIWDRYIKKVFAKKISSKLQECASEDLFFEVGPDDDMAEAMLHLFIKSTSGGSAVRLIN